MARPQHLLGLILRFGKTGRTSLNIDGEAAMEAVEAQENRQRDHHKVVLVLAQYAADLLHNSDHHEFIIPNANGFADRVDRGKQSLYQSVANHADLGPMFSF